MTTQKIGYERWYPWFGNRKLNGSVLAWVGSQSFIASHLDVFQGAMPLATWKGRRDGHGPAIPTARTWKHGSNKSLQKYEYSFVAGSHLFVRFLGF